VVAKSLDMQTKGLSEEIANAKEELCEEFELRTLDTRINIRRRPSYRPSKEKSKPKLSPDIAEVQEPA
jgi:hypothetical protein